MNGFFCVFWSLHSALRAKYVFVDVNNRFCSSPTHQTVQIRIPVFRSPNTDESSPVLPARIFRNPKIVVEISQNWDPNPKVSQIESQGTSQGFIKTPKRIMTFIWQRFRYKSGIIFTTLMLYDGNIASQPPKVTNLWQCLHEISTWRAVSESARGLLSTRHR